MSQRDVKNRIASVQNIRKITRAMEMVAAARLRRAEQRIEHLRPYAGAIRRMTRQAAEAAGGEIGTLPILAEHESEQRIALLLVTADRGLAGAFNSQIIRAGIRAAAGVRGAGQGGRLLGDRPPWRVVADVPWPRPEGRVHGLHRPSGLRQRPRGGRGPHGQLHRRQRRQGRDLLQRLRVAAGPRGAARDAAAAAAGDDPRGHRAGDRGRRRRDRPPRAGRVRARSRGDPRAPRPRLRGDLDLPRAAWSPRPPSTAPG